MRTRTTSRGLATAEPIAPVAAPAASFSSSDTSSLDLERETALRIAGYAPRRMPAPGETGELFTKW
eukprot:1481796-Pleurochrysis_carterae.AAC.1